MFTQNHQIHGTKVTSPYPVKLTPAETRLIFSLQKHFSPEYIYADCYFPKPASKTANLTSHDQLVQIDCLAVNHQGIFVFESKDYSGWLYGSAEQKYWTAVLDFGRTKNQFYNPILQNATHLTCLRELFPTHRLYSFIIFGRNSTVKTIITPPKDCYLCTPDNLHQKLATLSQNLLTTTEIDEIHRTIQAGRVIPSQITRNNHIAEVQHAKRLPNLSGSHFSATIKR